MRIEVTFGSLGDGGVHDVIVASPGDDVISLRRRWQEDGRILVVVVPTADPDIFDTRWFSTAGEIELCGSGAVAAAHVVLERGLSQSDRVSLRGRYFDVTATRSVDGIRIRMPHFSLTPFAVDDRLLAAAGAECCETCVSNAKLRTVVLQVPVGSDLSSMAPNFARLRETALPGMEALILTMGGDGAGLFLFRYFTPWHGLDESPVAASALSLLGPFWADRLGAPLLTGCQLSASAPRFELESSEAGTWISAAANVGRGP